MVLEKRTTVRPIIPPWILAITNSVHRVAPAAAGRLFFEMFLRPPRARIPQRELEWTQNVTKERWDASGREIAAWRQGSGPTVLLVHGWAGRGSQLGSLIAPLVAKGFRVVGLDLPGHGESEGKRSSLPESRWAVEEALRRYGPVHAIVAHSMGGAIVPPALESASGSPRLVFIGVSDDVIHATKRTTVELGFDEGIYEQFRRIAERRFEVRFDDYVLAANARRRNEPMLAIHSDDDREVPLSEAERWVANWPGAQLRAFSGLGHTRILRYPVVISEVIEFIGLSQADEAAEDAATAVPQVQTL